MVKQKVTDLIANLDAETADFDKKIGKSQKKLKDYGSQANKAASENKGLSASFDAAAGMAAQLPGPLGAVGGQVDSMIGTVSSFGLAWSATGGSIAAVVGAMTTGLPILAETERRLLQQEQLIRATGYSSGYTAEQLDTMARSLAMSTLTSTQEASKAISIMLTFRSVMGDTFKRAIYLSQDMASVMGGDVASSAKQLGKALEMPTEGVNSLRESGISFTKSQRDLIRDMEESGRVAEAQTYILDELEKQIGGAAGAEAGGLIGTVDTLGQTVDEAFEAFSKWSGIKPIVQHVIGEMAEGLTVIRDFFDPTTADEALDLMSERVKITQEMNKALDEAGDYEGLGSLFGYTKSDWFNDQRRLNEIDERLEALRKKRDDDLKEREEAERKAAEAAAQREKQRLEEKQQREKAAADEQSAIEKKYQEEKEQREAESADRARQRNQEQTDSWLIELSRRNMSEAELLNAKYMDEALRLADSKQKGLITEEAYQQGLSDIQQYYAEERIAMLREELSKQEKEQQGFWERYYQSMQKSATDTDELWRQTFDNFTTGFGNAFASAIMGSQSVSDALKNMAAGMAQSMLSALGKILAQRMVMWAMEKTILKGQASSEVARVSSEANSAAIIAGINAYKSTAAIPIVGPTLAPGAMTTALSLTEPMAAAATAAASVGFAGAFDNGGYIPAGKWGVTGEYGPEITLGPSHVIGRKQTMAMLTEATRGDNKTSSSPEQPIMINLNFSAIDKSGVEQLLMNHRDTIYNAVASVKNDRAENF